jgi:putative tryptophan/tyrosine transport system substrate-binding protein
MDPTRLPHVPYGLRFGDGIRQESSMERRTFMALVSGGLLAAPLAAEAQQAGKVWRIGFLSGSSAVAAKPFVEQFRQGLRELGYVEGENIIIEYRWAEGQPNRLPQLAIDLARMAPDLIVAGTSQPAMAAHKATTSIPIVMVNVGDPVYLGLATSLARPGKNLTGLTSFGPELAAKQLALLKEVVPEVKRIAVLNNPGNPLATHWLKETEAAARALAVQLQPLSITGPDDVATAFRDAMKGRAGAVLVAAEQVVNLQSAQISALALSNRLPTMFGNRLLMDAGGLMAYSIDFAAPYRRAATYVDKILKGGKPGDIPIEEPTKFELVINLKTAKALGLTIPPALLSRADEVIQ